MNKLTDGKLAIGIFLGVISVVLFEILTDFFGTSFSIPTEFIATIFGAAIALGGTFLTILAAKDERDEERNDRDIALILTVFVKAQKITNNIYHFRDHIERSFASVDVRSHKNPGLFVQALAGHPEPVQFTPDEKAAFLRWKDLELFNRVAEMEDIHNSLLRAFEKYAEKRDEFTSSTPAEMDGLVGTTEMNREEFSHVAPKISQLNHLVEQLRERCGRDYLLSVELTKALVAAVKNRTGLTIEMLFPD